MPKAEKKDIQIQRMSDADKPISDLTPGSSGAIWHNFPLSFLAASGPHPALKFKDCVSATLQLLWKRPVEITSSRTLCWEHLRYFHRARLSPYPLFSLRPLRSTTAKMSTTIDKVRSPVTLRTICESFIDDVFYLTIDQGDRVRNGSNSEEQEHIFPFGYGPSLDDDIRDSALNNFVDNRLRAIEGQAC